jgi:hypothetical protein
MIARPQRFITPIGKRRLFPMMAPYDRDKQGNMMAQRRKSSGEPMVAEEFADISVRSTLGESLASGGGSSGSAESTEDGRYEGQIFGIERDKIVGWAWDAARPYEPVDVELFIGDLRVGRGSADRFDIELAKAKRGNGMHRFEVSLDRLPPGSPPYVVRAVIADTEEELLPALSLATIEDAESLQSGNEYLGKVTGIVDGLLCGWVLNWHNPHEEPVLTLRDGDINILTRPTRGRTNAVINTGVTVNAYRFELPLPGNILDGKLHHLSVLAGPAGRELTGSPITFGPADVGSIGQSLAAVFERQQQLDQKVALLEPGYDQALLERRITGNVLDRVDMLLNIHRDALERELAVLRRQVTELLQSEGDPDVILPGGQRFTIDDEALQTAESFTVIARSAPLISYDLASGPESAKLSSGLKWSDSSTSSGILIQGNGSIELEGLPAGPASVILRGSGAVDPFEFCGMVTAFHGRTLTGRVEISETGDWTLVGTTVGRAVDDVSAKGLSVTYLHDQSQPSGLLRLNEIAVFHRGRVPERVDATPPLTTVLYVGTDSNRGGWYSIEPGPRGGLCWMGAQAELAIRVRQSGVYRLRIPEIRPLVRDVMPKLRITLGGVPMNVKVSPRQGDASVFEVGAGARVPSQTNAPGRPWSLDSTMISVL